MLTAKKKSLFYLPKPDVRDMQPSVKSVSGNVIQMQHQIFLNKKI